VRGDKEFRQFVDRAAASTVVACTCGWRELVINPDRAWQYAIEHAGNVHGDAQQAVNSQSAMFRARERRRKQRMEVNS